MRVVLTFYRNFSWFVIAISLLGCWLIWMYGAWQFITIVFWMKVFTNVLLGWFIHVFHADQFYFFANLGYGKIRLYVFTFMFDMLIWLMLSWVTIEMMP